MEVPGVVSRQSYWGSVGQSEVGAKAASVLVQNVMQALDHTKNCIFLSSVCTLNKLSKFSTKCFYSLQIYIISTKIVHLKNLEISHE